MNFWNLLGQSWNEFEGMEYYIEVTQQVDYVTASQICFDQQATLVVIKSEEVDNFLLSLPNPSSKFEISVLTP